MNKRTFNLTITTLLGIYLFLLAVNNKLGFYLNDRYFNLSKLTTAIILIISILGLGFSIYKDIKSKKFKAQIAHFKTLLKDFKLYVFIIFVLQIISTVILQINDTKLDIFNNFESLLKTFTSPILLILVGGALLLPWKESSFDKFLNKLNFFNVFLVFILVSAIILPPTTLTQIIFSQRQNNLNAFVGVGNSNESVIDLFTGSTENYEIGDWIRAINFEGDINKFEGKKAHVSGFITQQEGLSENQFLVSRFAISCCVLDATPVGLLAEYNWQEDYKKDEWIRVEGILTVKTINEREQLVIIVEKIETIEVPDKPYIS